MTTENIGNLASKIFDLIKGLKPQDSTRVIKAVIALCGISSNEVEVQVDAHPSAGANRGIGSGIENEAQYFSQKEPKTKMEMLAVAARYLEKKSSMHEYSKTDFSSFFKNARQNFDVKNFSADLRNAKNNGLFVKGDSSSGKHKLTYGGQNFVDALPDREKAEKHLKKTFRAKNLSKSKK